jgi:hypothetical protein
MALDESCLVPVMGIIAVSLDVEIRPVLEDVVSLLLLFFLHSLEAAEFNCPTLSFARACEGYYNITSIISVSI